MRSIFGEYSLNGGVVFEYFTLSVKVAIITFTTYLMIDENNVLTPEVAFVCLTLFDIIRLPLAMLPLIIVYMVEV
jgi:hypothetical protein